MHVVVHTSVSADGDVGGFTPDVGLHYELASTFDADVHLAGSDTILAAIPDSDGAAEDVVEAPRDDPGDDRPLLVVVDSRGRVRSWAALREAPHWRDRMVALCSRATPAAYLDHLAARHVDHVVAGERRVDLRDALDALERTYGATRVLVDSGGTLNGVLLRAGLVDEVSLLVHPQVVARGQHAPVFGPEDAAAAMLRLRSVERCDGDIVWLRYDVARTRNPTPTR